ncbi:MAG: MarC family protein [Burkholderiales bacterium]
MTEFFLEFGKGFLLLVAATLPILNPPGAAPIFLSLTEGATQATRRDLSTRIARNVFLMMAASLLVGSYLLDFFGISLPIMRVAGGLVVTHIGWSLLSANTSEARTARLTEAFTPEMVRLKAFYPLSFPTTFGPGTMAATITVGVSLADPNIAIAAARTSGAIAGTAVVAVLVLFSYRYAQVILRPLGETGTLIFLRLSAFILLCLGIQIMWDGFSPLLSEAVRAGLAGEV